MTIPEYDICACGERGPHEHSIETTRRIEAELRTSVKDSLKKPNWEVQSKVIGAKMKVIEAELLSMTAANLERVFQGAMTVYTERDFVGKANELRTLADELSEVAKSHSGL